MTDDKDLKRLVRARMAKTGESYTTALSHVRAGSGRQAPPRDSVPDEHAPEPAAHTERSGPEASDGVLSCSFCRKTQHEVANLIAGPGVYICTECVSGMRSLAADNVTDGALAIVTMPTEEHCSFCAADRATDPSGSPLSRMLRGVASFQWLPAFRRRTARAARAGHGKSARVWPRLKTRGSDDSEQASSTLYEGRDGVICATCLELCESLVRESRG